MRDSYPITTQEQVRASFWEQCEGYRGVSRKRITNYSGNGKMHNTDTRCAFVDFVDMLSKDRRVSSELAQRVTLD